MEIYHEHNAIFNLDLTSDTSLQSVHWPDFATDGMRFFEFYNKTLSLPPTTYRLLQETTSPRAWGDAMAGVVVVHNATTTVLASLMWRHLGVDPSQPLNNVTRLDVLGDTYGHLVNVPTASSSGQYSVYSFVHKDLAVSLNAALTGDSEAPIPVEWQGHGAIDLISNTSYASLPSKLALPAQTVVVLQRL